MVSQTLNSLFYLCNLIGFHFSPTLSTGRATCAVPGDYGFDFDATELENELLAQKFNGLPSQFIQPVEVSEFKMRYCWFVS
jgi:hypothetical protein